MSLQVQVGIDPVLLSISRKLFPQSAQREENCQHSYECPQKATYIKTFTATPDSDLYRTIIEVKDSDAWIVALLLASAFKPTFVITNVRASQLDTNGLYMMTKLTQRHYSSSFDCLS